MPRWTWCAIRSGLFLERDAMRQIVAIQLTDAQVDLVCDQVRSFLGA